jgi:hypothetical protein
MPFPENKMKKFSQRIKLVFLETNWNALSVGIRIVYAVSEKMYEKKLNLSIY